MFFLWLYQDLFSNLYFYIIYSSPEQNYNYRTACETTLDNMVQWIQLMHLE